MEEDDKKLVIRVPRNTDDTPSMHCVDMQESAMQMLLAARLPVPTSLLLGRLYLVETYMPGHDLLDLFQSSSLITDTQRIKIYKDVGAILRSMHSIRMNGFGELERHRYTEMLQGALANWVEFFDRDYPVHVKAIAQRQLFNQMTCDALSMGHGQLVEYMTSIYDRIRPHLVTFKDPCFVHADLCNNNIRVVIESGSVDNLAELNVKVKGIIDFADAISGDGLYDIGRILSHVHGDYRFVDAIAEGYSGTPFSSHQKEMILFYALSFATWLLEASDTPEELIKYNTIMFGNKSLTNGRGLFDLEQVNNLEFDTTKFMTECQKLMVK
eukprot:gene18004-21485_t